MGGYEFRTGDGGIGVSVAGISVGVGGTAVCVGGMGEAVGGVSVAVGGMGVAVAVGSGAAHPIRSNITTISNPVCTIKFLCFMIFLLITKVITKLIRISI